MADELSTIGSMAIVINNSFDNISDGVSGNMVIIVDTNRQHVANYVGQTIGSNSIADIYQPAIFSYSKADAIDFVQAQGDGEKLKLGDLSMEEQGEMSSKAWRMLGDSQLGNLGRKARHARSLS